MSKQIDSAHCPERVQGDSRNSARTCLLSGACTSCKNPARLTDTENSILHAFRLFLAKRSSTAIWRNRIAWGDVGRQASTT